MKLKRSSNIFIDNYVLVDNEWSVYEKITNLARIINCTYVVQFGAGWCRIPSKLEQESVFSVPNLLLAQESGCLERYKSDNSLILNLGLYVVTRSMLSPILSDYDRINSVYQTHRSDQQMVEYHSMLIVRGRLH